MFLMMGQNGKITKFHKLSYFYEIDIMRIYTGGRLGLKTNTMDKNDRFHQK